MWPEWLRRQPETRVTKEIRESRLKKLETIRQLAEEAGADDIKQDAEEKLQMLRELQTEADVLRLERRQR